jgi:hypothetical protein
VKGETPCSHHLHFRVAHSSLLPQTINLLKEHFLLRSERHGIGALLTKCAAQLHHLAPKAVVLNP